MASFCLISKFLLHLFPGAEYCPDSVTSSGLAHRRHFYTEPQLALLEAEFASQPFPNKNGRRSIAMQLGVSEKSVLVRTLLSSLIKCCIFSHSIYSCSGGFKIVVAVPVTINQSLPAILPFEPVVNVGLLPFHRTIIINLNLNKVSLVNFYHVCLVYSC